MRRRLLHAGVKRNPSARRFDEPPGQLDLGARDRRLDRDLVDGELAPRAGERLARRREPCRLFAPSTIVLSVRVPSSRSALEVGLVPTILSFELNSRTNARSPIELEQRTVQKCASTCAFVRIPDAR
jgi:hypothetical protein